QRTLRTAARYADMWHGFGTPAQIANKIEVLRKHCREVGRDPSEILPFCGKWVVVRENAADAKKVLERIAERHGMTAPPGPLVPDIVGRLAKGGNEVVVERGAGQASSFPDRMYTEAGATIGDAWSAELVLKVAKPSDDELGRLREGTVLIAFLQPLVNHALVRELARRRVTALSMDAIPRITRAQPMDALSSQATVAGYKAVLL